MWADLSVSPKSLECFAILESIGWGSTKPGRKPRLAHRALSNRIALSLEKLQWSPNCKASKNYYKKKEKNTTEKVCLFTSVHRTRWFVDCGTVMRSRNLDQLNQLSNFKNEIARRLLSDRCGFESQLRAKDSFSQNLCWSHVAACLEVGWLQFVIFKIIIDI